MKTSLKVCWQCGAQGAAKEMRRERFGNSETVYACAWDNRAACLARAAAKAKRPVQKQTYTLDRRIIINKPAFRFAVVACTWLPESFEAIDEFECLNCEDGTIDYHGNPLQAGATRVLECVILGHYKDCIDCPRCHLPGMLRSMLVCEPCFVATTYLKTEDPQLVERWLAEQTARNLDDARMGRCCGCNGPAKLHNTYCATCAH